MLLFVLLISSVFCENEPDEYTHKISILLFNFKKMRKIFNLYSKNEQNPVLTDAMKRCYNSMKNHEHIHDPVEQQQCLQIMYNNDYFWS